MSGYFEGLVGTRLGGYVVRRMIARGGMGVVYEGYQESLDRPVAIKILYPHLSDDPGFRERFQREARALAQLNHPNIVRVIDFGIAEHHVYMIMELVSGHSLRDELIEVRQQGKAMSIERSLDILNAVGQALSYAHERGFVHRDVKPGNILIDDNGQVYLTDFGLVKLEEVAGVTATGAVMGTPEYMAPEQFLATSTAGPAADQYALAVVAYEMLVGRVPFQAPTPVGLLQKHLEEEPPAINTGDGNLPQTLEPVIRRGLAKDPTTRYPTVTTFVRDLQESATVKLPTVATAETLPDQQGNQTDTPPRMAAAAGAGAVAAGAGAATAPPLAGQVVSGTAPSGPPVGAVGAPTAVSTPARPASASPSASRPDATARPLAGGGGAAPPRAATPTAESSRPGWLKWVLIAVIPLLLIGGVGAALLAGGDDDDPDPTPTVLAVVDATATNEPAEPTPTTEDEPTPTEAVEPTPTNTTEPTPTQQPGEPTPTRAPVVVTRPIQNAPTPTPGIISIPTPADDDGEFSTLVSSDFVEGENTAIWATSTDRPEFTTQVLDGHYVVDILSTDPNGYSVFSYPEGATDLSDGAVAVRVRVDGGGSAGVLVRRTENADGTVSMYECHVANTQEFSCWKQVNSEWSEIVPLQYSDAIVPNDYNMVVVAAVGNQFALQINEVDVASWTDDSVSSGAWGVFVERNAGAANLTAWYDAVLVVQD
jgi:serine/threonine-protein kinase